MCQACGLIDLLIRGIQFAKADVFHNGARKQVGILQHNSQRMPQICLFDLVDVDIVIADFSILNVIKTVDQVGNRRLTRASGAHKGQLLPRLCIERNVFEYHFIVGVAKG